MEGGLTGYAKAAAAAKIKADREAQGREPSSPGKKYIGVRSRYGNKFGADIRDPSSGNAAKRLWLGTYDTAEEAACAHDAAVRTLNPNSRTNFPDLGEKEERDAVVHAHLAKTKRKLADKLARVADGKMEAAESALAGARDIVSALPAPPPSPAPAGDVVDLTDSPTGSPGEDDAVAALEMLQGQGQAPEPVASSVSPAPPPPSVPHFAPSPVSEAFNSNDNLTQAASGGASVAQNTPVLALPALVNSFFPSPHAMALPPPPGFPFAPIFDPPPLASHFPPRWIARPPGFHLAPAPTAPATEAVVTSTPSPSTMAPVGGASAPNFASFWGPVAAPPANNPPHTTAPPPGFHPAPASATTALPITPETWEFLYQYHAALSPVQAQHHLKILRELLPLSSFGPAIMNTDASSSAAPAISESQPEVEAFRKLYRLLEKQAAGAPVDATVYDPGKQDGRRKKKRSGGA